MTPLHRLAPSQRVVLVVGLGAILFFVGDYITALGGGYPTGWTGYAPLQAGLYPPRYLDPLAALLTWLLLVAVWVAASLFILRPNAAGRSEDAATEK